MNKQLLNGLLITGLLAITAVCILQSGARLCGPPVVRTLARTETVVNIREDKNNEDPATPKSKRKVVILTYMRSGSSLTGNILQESPEVFYVYEPLWYIGKAYNGKVSRKLTFVDNSSIELPAHIGALNIDALHFLQAFLDCRLEEISIEVLMQWTSKKSKVMSKLLECTKGKKTASVIRTCIQTLTTLCLKTKVNVVKIIRESMQEMHTILHFDPNVKIIHLLRDPRGALRSRKFVGEFKWENIRSAAAKMCSRIWDDLQMARVLWRRFPGRILTLRYEDIVASPLEAARQIYNYLGLDLTQDIRNFVWNSTYAGHPDDCNICTTRTNATVTAYKWRTDPATFPQILAAQAECTNVMNALGYNILSTSEEILDQTIPSTLGDLGMEGALRIDVRKNSINFPV